jgi:hypothetical protein
MPNTKIKEGDTLLTYFLPKDVVPAVDLHYIAEKT